MKTSIFDTQKKRGRGRPATGTDPLIGVRMPSEQIERLDKWAAKEGLPRATAARKAIIDRLDQEEV